MLVEYVAGLRAFLRNRITEDEANRRLASQLERREADFLALLDRAVLARPESPYARLLAHAGIESGDLRALVADVGVEGTLERLFEAGVCVSIDEFKGKAPIRRGSLELAVTASDFDNPLVAKQFTASTGGSGGAARPLAGSFELFEEFALYRVILDRAFEVTSRPLAVWQPMPPSLAGIAAALVTAKVGRPIARWFSPTRVSPGRTGLQQIVTVGIAFAGCRLWGSPVPLPRHVPPDRADVVARWLANALQAGYAPVLQATPSSAVRVCVAAQDRGLDLTGTLFIFGGEPYSEAKAAIVARSGCRGLSPYGMSELGWIGMPCPAADAVDDVHLIRPKVAVVARPHPLLSTREGEALHLTSLQRGSPKLMLNVESGDFGVLENRACGCAIEAAGYSDHLHTIRSYEKLTSEGMTFLATNVVTLVEDVLPTRFGGAPTDYQLVEREDEGVGRVELRVSPRLGPLDRDTVGRVVLDFLQTSSPHEAFMAEVWRAADTIRVVRTEPHTTASSKVLPLHVVRPGGAG